MKLVQSVLGSAACLAMMSACGGNSAPPETAGATSESTAAAVSPSAAPVASAAPVDPNVTVVPPPKVEMPPAPPVVLKYAGFSTPESVYFDEKNDRYLVSNINGAPFALDNNGYISELSPDGKVLREKWIAAGVANVTLNAPKGVAIAGGVLYVADVDHVRMFDAKSGAPKGAVAIKGATFLNDVAAGPDGKVYVSDTGVKGEKFEATGTDAVHVIEKGKSKVFFQSADLLKPNGLVANKKGVFVNTFGGAEVFRLDPKTGKQDIVKTPKGGLDGLAIVGESVFASSWEGMSVYRANGGGVFEPILTGLKAPADFAIDTKRNRIIVPRFQDNIVEVYEIPAAK